MSRGLTRLVFSFAWLGIAFAIAAVTHSQTVFVLLVLLYLVVSLVLRLTRVLRP